MNFGKVDNPAIIDFTLPKDHIDTKNVLAKYPKKKVPNLYVGCAKWNRADLKGFYPRGTKDELAYYSTQFNSIELNATFYRIFPSETFAGWYDKTPSNFRFFPKLFQGVSHWKRLVDAEAYLNEYILNASNLQEKLEMPFLQLHSNFSPKSMDRLVPFFEQIPKDMRLAIEFRHTDWFNDPVVANELYHILDENNITNIVVDTAGRRDLMHMRMTTDTAFIRYNGANHETDYTRLDDWIDRLEEWIAQGLQNIYFFVHQNLEQASPLLSAHFIKQANERFGTTIHVPEMATPKTLF
ncbi:DUF72 domain-containing protein [Ulvibacter litoralis]|uniref:Uncharacterized conserved protein YecE, DUF72 family n=1 Tax=Ulvibacter litoralis TaxID=227084 RepID=A0A1G7FE77_9FLAO|nr:DUF72 domain-containing protein [Ulvibacter litoralis]GHC51646.1 hypothetical protein GCM10008083_14170 [Ulvibacter litoralis]SDE73865.1 Uncharacterized conserved protein YecE, DUF72 family [Ulvibacter litoralis]